jgi:hypothetical protein
VTLNDFAATDARPVRRLVVVFAATVYPTEPAPVRPVPFWKVMKLLRLEAFQEQPVGVVTKIVPVAAASEMLMLAGLIEYVQVEVAAGAACRTVKILPATVALPLRKLLVFAATPKATDPDPVPPLPLGNVRNPLLLAALQAQPVCVVTVIVPLVDAADVLRSEGLIE